MRRDSSVNDRSRLYRNRMNELLESLSDELGWEGWDDQVLTERSNTASDHKHRPSYYYYYNPYGQRNTQQQQHTRRSRAPCRKQPKNNTRHYCHSSPTPLRLNDNGVAWFRCGKFTIVLEVPAEGDHFAIYTLLSRVDPSRTTHVLTKALGLNYLQQATRGACISLDPTVGNDMVGYHDDDELNEKDGPEYKSTMELNLSFWHPIVGTDADEFCRIVGNFCVTAHDLAVQLA